MICWKRPNYKGRKKKGSLSLTCLLLGVFNSALHLNYEFITTGRSQMDSWRHLEGVAQKSHLQFTGHVNLWNLLHKSSIRKKLVTFWSNSLTYCIDCYVGFSLWANSLVLAIVSVFCLKLGLVTLFEIECDNVSRCQ